MKSYSESEPAKQFRLDPDQVQSRIKLRHQAMQSARAHFNGMGFFEIDSPILIPANCVETHIEPMLTKVDDGRGGEFLRYLHTSPEIYHKRLLSYGADKIYQLGHVFRNGEKGSKHLPEFALLEWYRSGGSLDDLIADCESLFSVIAVTLLNRTEVTSPNNRTIDLAPPFDRITMEEVWLRHAQIDLRAALQRMAEGDHLALVRAVEDRGHYLRNNADFEDAFHHVMAAVIEPKIGQNKPIVVEKWPSQMACLSQICPSDPLFAQRFEIYCDQIELANAFDELTDPNEQFKRFEEENRSRKVIGKPDLPIDHLFISDLSLIPRSVGIAVGFDRLLMLILSQREINEVFPLPW